MKNIFKPSKTPTYNNLAPAPIAKKLTLQDILQAIKVGNIELLKVSLTTPELVDDTAQLELQEVIKKSEIQDALQQLLKKAIETADHDFLTVLIEKSGMDFSENVFKDKTKLGINSTWVKYAPIHLAAKENNAKAIEILLARGVNPNARSDSGSTALHYAASEGSIDAIRVLLAQGAKMNACNQFTQTPISCTIVGCDKVLGAYNGDVYYGNLIYPSDQTSKNKHLPTFKFLMEAGADINCLYSYVNMTDAISLLRLASFCKANEIAEVIEDRLREIEGQKYTSQNSEVQELKACVADLTKQISQLTILLSQQVTHQAPQQTATSANDAKFPALSSNFATLHGRKPQTSNADADDAKLVAENNSDKPGSHISLPF